MNRPIIEPLVKYEPHHCKFSGETVWAILTRQPDGSWKIVNCLDKCADCFDLPCAFTNDQGEWPLQKEANV